MPFKTDEDGHFAKDEATGLPLWTNAQGQDEPYDADAVQRKLAAANREAAERRQALDEATERLEAFEPLADLLGDNTTPANIAQEIRTLRRKIKSMPKGGELDEEVRGKLEKLDELEGDLAEARAKLGASEKKVETLTGEVGTVRQQLQRSTVGREVRSSSHFTGRNGDQPLTTMDPAQGEDYFSSFGAPDPEDPSRILFYKTKEAAAKRDRTEIIYNEDGEPADVDTAISKLGPSFGWWKTYQRSRDAGGSGAGDGKDAGAGGTAKLSKAQMRNSAVVDSFIDTHGAEAYQKELERHAAEAT